MSTTYLFPLQDDIASLPSMKTVRLAIALFAFAFAASAEPVSTFLSEVKFESATKGTTNAIA